MEEIRSASGGLSLEVEISSFLFCGGPELLVSPTSCSSSAYKEHWTMHPPSCSKELFTPAQSPWRT